MKAIIRNLFDNKVNTFSVPAGAAAAQAFADGALDSVYEIYHTPVAVGSDVVASYNSATIIGENLAGAKVYIDVNVKSTVSSEDIIGAVATKTFDGVKFDKVSIINFRQVTV